MYNILKTQKKCKLTGKQLFGLLISFRKPIENIALVLTLHRLEIVFVYSNEKLIINSAILFAFN